MYNVDKAIHELNAGRPLILFGADDQNGEADLVFSATLSTTQLMTSCVQHTGGYIGVALTAQRCDELQLPPQHWSQFAHGRAACVAVDANEVGTGISARDRSLTARLLADRSTTHQQLTRPGHVIPLRSGVGSDYVDAAVQLALLAGQAGAAVVSRLVSEEDPTQMLQGAEIFRFAERYRLCTVTATEILGYSEVAGAARLASAVI